MKRLQIMLEEDLDAELARMAREQRTSKAALIRRFVRECLTPLPPIEEDPLFQLVGVDDYEPEDIDTVLYGPDLSETAHRSADHKAKSRRARE